MRKLTYNRSKTYQVIDNFGASACWWIDPAFEHMPTKKMEEIATLLFDRNTGAGLSCIRFNIGGGSSWYDKEFIENWMMRAGCFQIGPEAPYNWNEHAGQQWLLKRAKEMKVEETIAFVNSPPAWFCESGHTRADEKTGTTNLKRGFEEKFARFLADVLKHFEEIGLPFDYISPINEPQVPWDTAKQEGCRYSNEDTVRTVVAIKKALEESGVQTKLLVNECNNILALIDLDLVLPYSELLIDGGIKRGWQFGGKYCENIKDVFNLPEIRNAVAPIIAAHSYGTDVPGTMVAIREMVKTTMERYPGYRYWMSEYCVLGEYGPKRDLGIDAGLYIAKVIHSDLAVLNASAWQWWLAVSGGDYKDGLVYIDLDEDGNSGEVYPSKMLWALAHYSRFLRPGSVRIELLGGDEELGLLATGWIDANGREVIVIFNTNETEEMIEIVGGTGNWNIWKTSELESMENDDSLNGNILLVQGKSMITLTQKM